MKFGAYDYYIKPDNAEGFEELLGLLSKAIEAGRAMSEQVVLGSPASNQDALLGNGRAMQAVYKDIGRVAERSIPVLIYGEPGTGKELIARAIYQHSNRAQRAFLVVDCVAMPEAILEVELFGNEPGAFSEVRRIGRIEQANEGTIFLKEIGSLNLHMQMKLLQLLSDKFIQRLNGREMIPLDVRLIASTQSDLELAVRRKEFLPELLRRLERVVLHVPNLQARKEDIPLLVNYFLERHGNEFSTRVPSITPEAMKLLQEHSWPGNVRELEKSLRKLLLRAGEYAITADHVREALGFAISREEPLIDFDLTATPENLALKQRARVEEFRRKHRLALLTLMFTDIVGSTNLKQKLGDQRAVILIQKHHALIRHLLSHFKESEEIETAGDSFFIVFARPSDAVRFGLLLQSKLRDFEQKAGYAVPDRIGIHVGEVIVEQKDNASKDLYGMQVDICARVTSLAQAGQILLTRSAFDNARQVLKGQLISGIGNLEWQIHGQYILKGIEDPLDICEVGESGVAPLKAPADSEKVHRYSPP